jgi:hypothetical protein
VGDSVTIIGSNFGEKQASSTVTFNKKLAKPTTWSDTSILVVVPSDATTGDVVVTVGGKASEGVKFTLPTIATLSEDSGAVGDPVIITGTDFGATQGSSIVTFNTKPVKSAIWSANSITVAVPSGATTGPVVVRVGDKASAGKTFQVKPPEYDQSSFEVLTGVGAVLSGVEATSYKTANDVLSSTNVGRKAPEILLGGGFILPWRKLGGWIENSYCGTDKDRQAVKARGQTPSDNCQPGGAYDHYRPWEAFLSIRFAPASDQTINGFVVGGGYRITKFLSMVIGYSVTPVDEPSLGFRVAAAQTASANSTIFPYSRYNHQIS